MDKSELCVNCYVVGIVVAMLACGVFVGVMAFTGQWGIWAVATAMMASVGVGHLAGEACQPQA